MSASAHKEHDAEVAAERVRLADLEHFEGPVDVNEFGEVQPVLPFTAKPTPQVGPSSVQLICGDVIDVLRDLPAGRVSCVVTSPPYFGLRSYGIPPRTWADGTVCVLGDEPTLDLYIQHLVEVFREVKRVLHPRGSCWMNMGDGYAKGSKAKRGGLTTKDLMMVPARAAIALQEDGWILRQDIIWAKGLSFCPGFSGSVMPESTTDRSTWAHEHLFHLALRPDYFYDPDGCREPYAETSKRQVQDGYRGRATKDYDAAGAQNPSDSKRRIIASIAAGHGRNLRNVWVVPKQNFKGAHFATFPEKLVEPVVKLATSAIGVCAACAAPIQRRTVREDVPASVKAAFEASRATTAIDTGRTDGHTSRRPNYRRKVLREEWEPSCACGAGFVPAMVMDIFSGSGRAGMVSKRLGRSYVGIDINKEYNDMAQHAIDRVERV